MRWLPGVQAGCASQAGSLVNLFWPKPSAFNTYISAFPFRPAEKAILEGGEIGVGTGVYVGLVVEVGYGVGRTGVTVGIVTGVYVGIGIYVGIGV